MTRATGIGSMRGGDFGESFKVVLGETPDLPFVPELPERGLHAQMVGRTLGLLDGLGADVQPDGWRIGVGEGVDQRRARSLLAQDLDVAEELAHELEGPLKVQVCGPLTLAAAVEHPRGEKVIGDHGARRDLAESLASGLVRHVADVRRRFSRADVLVQVDEPGLRAVLDGRVPTASGYRTHRSVEPAEVDALLRRVVEAIDGPSVVHTCAPDVPVALLRGVGFGAVAFDLLLARPGDQWAEAFDAGTDLWTGVTPGDDAAPRIERFFGALGFELESFADRLVVTTPCGGVTREGLSATSALAARLDGRLRR